MPDLHQFLCMLPMVMTQSCSGSIAVCYVLMILWMTSSLYIIARNRPPKKYWYTLWLNRGSTDLTPQWILKNSPPRNCTAQWAESDIYNYLIISDWGQYLQQTSNFWLSIWNVCQSCSLFCITESTDDIAKCQQTTVYEDRLCTDNSQPTSITTNTITTTTTPV